MSGLLAAITSPAISSIVGAVGGIVGKVSDNRKELKELEFRLSHEREMGAIENTRVQLELQNKKDVANIDADTKKVLAELQLVSDSYDNDTARYSGENLSTVDKVRGLTRPVITGLLTGYMVILTGYTLLEYGDSMSDAEMAKMAFLMVETLANLASLSVSWWFGSRVTVTKK